jgi:hypothetical protein
MIEMDNPGIDLIFPPRSVSPLRNERGKTWQELVKAVENTGLDSPEQMAFILMMARLNNCVTCNAGSYRAINGCTICARQSLKRFHGSDEDLSALFETARTNICVFLQNNCASDRHK